MTPVADHERARMRERPTERPIMRQIWRHLGFLHWPIAADAIARVLPPGLEVDTFDGVAYLGIVPFTIPLTRAAGWPRAPLAPAFHELNLRTYVHRGGREPGVWFFSLDAASRLAVMGARVAYHLPYFYAAIAMDVAGGGEGAGDDGGETEIEYRSRRRSRTADARFACRYRPTGQVALAKEGSSEFFLAERYLLYAWTGRKLKSARVFHAPYPLQPAVATDVQQTAIAAAGLAVATEAPPLVHYAREVDVQIYRPGACG
jgi:uncharacterized protein